MNKMTCREKILSQDYWDFILPGDRGKMADNIPENSYCRQQMDFGYESVSVDKSLLSPLNIEEYWYNSIPNCYTLLDSTGTNNDALNSAGILQVQNYPTLRLMGEGVMIGFLDTGIDYRNPVFQNIDGSTRIAGLWDQTIQTGNAPKAFDYGSEYREEMLNEALRSEDPLSIVPTTDTNGHGTYLASIAAGNADVNTQFLGAAPEAILGIVKLKEAKNYLRDFYLIREDAVCYQENDIMAGLKYLNDLAENEGLPLVLCIALGTNFGGHNGTTLLSRILDQYALQLNRSVVIGGGNEAAMRHHFSYTISEKMSQPVIAEIRVGSGINGFVAELWTKLPMVVTIVLISPSGERTRQVAFRQGYRYNFVFTFERTEVMVEYRLLLENNDSQLLFMQFKNPVAGIWKIEIESATDAGGEVHLWLPVQEFLEGEVYFLEANPDVTLTEPGSTENAMTVAYYNSVDNAVDINSGRGYTRSNLIKPDFTAPGVRITGASGEERWVTRSGSSAGTAVAAGAAALLTEWILEQPGAKGVNSSQIRNIIILGAENLSEMERPNRQWGYGKMDVYHSLDTLRRL